MRQKYHRFKKKKNFATVRGGITEFSTGRLKCTTAEKITRNFFFSLFLLPILTVVKNYHEAIIFQL